MPLLLILASFIVICKAPWYIQWDHPSLLTNSNQCYIVHGFFSYCIGHCQHSTALCYCYCNGHPMTWSSHPQWFLFIQEGTVTLTKITHYHISMLFNDVSYWHFIPLAMDEWMSAGHWWKDRLTAMKSKSTGRKTCHSVTLLTTSLMWTDLAFTAIIL